MPTTSNQARKWDSILLVGEGNFFDERLKSIAVQLKLSVVRQIEEGRNYSLAILQATALAEFEQLNSTATPLIVVGDNTSQIPWKTEGRISELMSQEAIVQVINNALFRKVRENQHPRYSVELSILVTGDKRSIQTTTVDISESGLYARSLNPHPQSTGVQLQLVGAEPIPKLFGVVVYTIETAGDRIVQQGKQPSQVIAHPGMAIQFDKDQTEEIKQWLFVAKQAVVK